MKPDGSFDDPGWRNLAIIPATKPIMMSQRICIFALLNPIARRASQIRFACAMADRWSLLASGKSTDLSLKSSGAKMSDPIFAAIERHRCGALYADYFDIRDHVRDLLSPIAAVLEGGISANNICSATMGPRLVCGRLAIGGLWRVSALIAPRDSGLICQERMRRPRWPSR